MKPHYILFALAVVFAQSCTTKPKEEKTAAIDKAQEEIKDVSELTYYEIYKIALKDDNGGGMDFHGDAYGTDALEQISLLEGGSCGENDCGRSIILKNSSSKDVNAVIRATYDLPGNPSNEMVRAYSVPADSSINVGCSHLCWNGKGYQFSREIIQAGYATSK